MPDVIVAGRFRTRSATVVSVAGRDDLAATLAVVAAALGETHSFDAVLT